MAQNCSLLFAEGAHCSSTTQGVTVMYIDTNVSTYHMYMYIYIDIYIGAHDSSPTQSITVMYIDTNVSTYHMYMYVYIHIYI